MTARQIESNLPADHNQRMARALLSLDGLSVGDALGQRFFQTDVESLSAVRAIPRGPWRYTDDTMMALSIVETLDQFGFIGCDFLAERFAARYTDDPNRGYGPTAMEILAEIGRGIPWQIVSGEAFKGAGSMGNGGAMRVGPVGAYFADDFGQVVRNARASAEVTHAHLEGKAGAIAVAVAVAQAWRMQSGEAPLAPQSILDAALEYTPDGMTRRGLKTALAISLDDSIEKAVGMLGNGSRVISHDTVPFALWCAARHLTDYEGAFWTTVSGLGDIDTNCAIVGSIVAVAAGRASIPAAWLETREPLRFSV